MKLVLALATVLLAACNSNGFGTPRFGDAPPIREKLTKEIEAIPTKESKYNELYLQAKTADPAGKEARNELIMAFVIPIQNYHEVMNNDIFVNSTVYGSALDIIAVAAAAIATAVVPAGTKTWWAAVATIAGGTKLALSKNVLQEKTANVILATMVAERQVCLIEIRKNMAKSTGDYPVETAIIDLNTFLNTGSLDKSMAKAEANAQKKAEDQVRDALKPEEPPRHEPPK